MKILFAASECYPFAKTGGLGDVVGALPKELIKCGAEVRVILPKYGDIPEAFVKDMKHITDFYFFVSWRNQYCGIEELQYEGVTYYFIDNEYYFKRSGYYGYYDDGEKFVYFSKAIVECIKAIGFKPDIIHCHDWHTALIPFFVKKIFSDDFYKDIRTVLTIHNLKYQGVFPKDVLGDLLGIGESYFNTEDFEFYGAVNFLKTGIIYSDSVTTVSPTYAQEIQYEYFGEKLDGLLRKNNFKLKGILNGIDYELYNPEKDNHLKQRYKDSYAVKLKNKLEFQKMFSLPQNKDIPMISIVSRLTEQKGIDLIQAVIHEILVMDIQLAVLGSGEYKYEQLFKDLVWQYPDKIRVFIKFDELLSRRIYAASDMMLMPSRYEPCGLTQMIAMKYGAVPIVRKTGGLNDTVTSYEEDTSRGTGFVFNNYNAHEFLFTVQRAVRLYYDNKEEWDKLFNNAIAEDLSWKKSASAYFQNYNDIKYHETGRN